MKRERVKVDKSCILARKRRSEHGVERVRTTWKEVEFQEEKGGQAEKASHAKNEENISG